MLRISFSDLVGVLPQREGHVVVKVLRAEERAVLEQHPEELAGLVELALREPGQVLAVDVDVPGVGLEQPDQGLEENRLARARGAEHDADLALGERQRDVLPDGLAAETLGEPLDANLDTHEGPASLVAALSAPRWNYLRHGPMQTRVTPFTTIRVSQVTWDSHTHFSRCRQETSSQSPMRPISLRNDGAATP